MSAFDKLKSQAQKYLHDHPDHVQRGKDAVSQKLGRSQKDGRKEGQGEGHRDQPRPDQDSQR